MALPSIFERINDVRPGHDDAEGPEPVQDSDARRVLRQYIGQPAVGHHAAGRLRVSEVAVCADRAGHRIVMLQAPAELGDGLVVVVADDDGLDGRCGAWGDEAAQLLLQPRDGSGVTAADLRHLGPAPAKGDAARAR